MMIMHRMKFFGVLLLLLMGCSESRMFGKNLEHHAHSNDAKRFFREQGISRPPQFDIPITVNDQVAPKIKLVRTIFFGVRLNKE